MLLESCSVVFLCSLFYSVSYSYSDRIFSSIFLFSALKTVLPQSLQPLHWLVNHQNTLFFAFQSFKCKLQFVGIPNKFHPRILKPAHNPWIARGFPLLHLPVIYWKFRRVENVYRYISLFRGTPPDIFAHIFGAALKMRCISFSLRENCLQFTHKARNILRNFSSAIYL